MVLFSEFLFSKISSRQNFQVKNWILYSVERRFSQ